MASVTLIEDEDFDGQPAWRMTGPDGSTAFIAARGATLLSWQPAGGKELIAGYRDAAELQAQDGKRSLVMVPWCGRIAGGQYSFGSKHLTSEQDEDLLEHGGKAGRVDFSRKKAGDALVLAGTLAPSSGYPWQLDISVVFSLESGASGLEHLSVSITVVNASQEDVPVSIGWHPYLTMPGMEGVSNLSLTVPARGKILSDPNLIPLPGDAAMAGINAPARVDYVGQQRIDRTYTELVPSEDGVVVSRLVDPASGREILLTQEPTEAPALHVYTGDFLERDSRKAIAFEPTSALSDAFNRADSANAIKLAPGHEKGLTLTLSYRG
ncbi:MAG: aldose 1-epimerase [Ancrocorticia sp.]|uniref:aldose 1-epimerase n=1 Tax=Ancrocorticia sp. TaxID=2593684 RepID=UPI003F91E7B6